MAVTFKAETEVSIVSLVAMMESRPQELLMVKNDNMGGESCFICI